MGGNWILSSGDIDYARWFLASMIRVFSVWRIHLPSQFRIDPRSVRYERNGETDPIDRGNWGAIVWKCRVVQAVSG